jgi:hypothetical protein
LIPRPLEFGRGILGLTLTGEHVGCGCRDIQQLAMWFNSFEMRNLAHLGYSVVKLDGCRLLAESEMQVVFARSKPLCVVEAEISWDELQKAWEASQ